MALVNCPECKNEMSDQAEMCPHCGYKNPYRVIKTYENKTQLGEPYSNRIAGVFGLLSGIGFMILFIVWPLAYGFFFIIPGLAFIILSINCLFPMQNGTCPYCKSPIKIEKNAGSIVCPCCHKRVIKNGNYLERIE